jgi:quercetin dioxygenase-like cupin family protein
MDVVRGERQTMEGPQGWFTGEVSIEPLVSPSEPSRLQVLRVHFHPGARTAWHSHPLGQLLVVTEGAGRAASAGAAPRDLRAGDVVTTPPGEWHWHGAGPESEMTHLAVQEAGPGGEAVWGDPVTEEDYRGA